MVWGEPGCTSPATAAQPAPGWRASTTANPPVAGRCPPTRAPQDLAHWQLRLRVAELEAIADRAEAHGGRVISGGIIELGQQAEAIGAIRALQLADPDGHRLQLLQG